MGLAVAVCEGPASSPQLSLPWETIPGAATGEQRADASRGTTAPVPVCTLQA